MILALDSSCEEGSAAVVDAGRLVRSMAFRGGRARGGGAATALAEIVDGIEGFSGVVVGLGPGSYSGIRSAVAAAWGFAAARGVPLESVSSLLAIAPGEYLAVGDARQAQFYAAHVKEAAFLSGPALVSADGLASAIGRFPALPVYAPREIEHCPRATPRAPQAALLASFFAATRAPDGLPAMPEPLYLKPPNITQPRGQARTSDAG